MEEEWIGKFYGVSERNSINVTFQSKTHPGMIYEYNLQRRHKKNPDVGIFRCSGCRSENSKAKNAELPVVPKVTYVTGTICESNRIVKFHSDPDKFDHCCWRRTPHQVKAKKIRRQVRNKVRQSGLTGGDCLDMLHDTVLEKDKNDADYVLQETGTSENIKRILRQSAKSSTTIRSSIFWSSKFCRSTTNASTTFTSTIFSTSSKSYAISSTTKSTTF